MYRIWPRGLTHEDRGLSLRGAPSPPNATFNPTPYIFLPSASAIFRQVAIVSANSLNVIDW